MFSVAIVGITGYTGQVLYELISAHPHFNLKRVFARKGVGESLKTYCPVLQGAENFLIEAFDPNQPLNCDAVFLALPHASSHVFMKALMKQNCKIFDLSADFRFSSKEIFEKTYGVSHESPELLDLIPYALVDGVELDYQKPQAFAIPGCYATAVNLALKPFLDVFKDAVTHCVVDAKSGVSGAGKSLSSDLLFCEVNESFKAYKSGCHRHEPEMAAFLGCDLFFSPHLIPQSRGILADCYLTLNRKFSVDKIQTLYEDAYQKAPFVSVQSPFTMLNTSCVQGSNFCHLACHIFEDRSILLIQSAIDNLLKGASGQAIEVANRAFNFDDQAGLPSQARLF